MRKKWFLFFLLIIFTAALVWHLWPQSSTTEARYHPPARTKTSDCKIVHGLPDPGCTPGAIDTKVTLGELCARRTEDVRTNSKRLDREVFESYGVSRHDGVERENDHLISLCLGGNDGDIANHFPQAYEDEAKLKAGQLRDQDLGAHAKDRVEMWLCRCVCKKGYPLEVAQRRIATNWLELFHEYKQRSRGSCPRT